MVILKDYGKNGQVKQKNSKIKSYYFFVLNHTKLNPQIAIIIAVQIRHKKQ